jgi:hypothetical protein
MKKVATRVRHLRRLNQGLQLDDNGKSATLFLSAGVFSSSHARQPMHRVGPQPTWNVSKWMTLKQIRPPSRCRRCCRRSNCALPGHPITCPLSFSHVNHAKMCRRPLQLSFHRNNRRFLGPNKTTTWVCPPENFQLNLAQTGGLTRLICPLFIGFRRFLSQSCARPPVVSSG